MRNLPAREGDIVCISPKGNSFFSEPEEILTVWSDADFPAFFAAAERHLAEDRFLAGYICYEAGWWMIGRPTPRQTPEWPLAWLGVYRDRECGAFPALHGGAITLPGAWRPGITEAEYRSALARIRDWIEAGDTYQVNFTFPLLSEFRGDPVAWFESLYRAQPTPHAAYVHGGRHQALSLSPECFFRLEGARLSVRPMKGTARRGLYPARDALVRERLRGSDKERAENLMIVDLLRNDLGRVSDIGSVTVDSLFDVERYSTIWQMTSSIHSSTRASFTEIFRALFPSGSVTGAPKIRAMEIIEAVERYPRGVYCGSIGWWGPGRRAEWNVAIRTIMLDTHSDQAAYFVGSGVTWDSLASAEHSECLAKAAILTRPKPAFQLLESLLLEGAGYFLLDRHLDRLCASADYFDIPARREHWRQLLLDTAKGLEPGRWKVRLLVDRTGTGSVSWEPLRAWTVPVALQPASGPVDSNDVFLYHKTTCRECYESALRQCTEADEALLYNERGEITETPRANVAMEFDGIWVTPPVSSGLLAGCMRAELLEAGVLTEREVLLEELRRASRIAIFNSVRGWMPAQLQTPRQECF